MASACSRWSQPPKAAISNWNGSTGAVYASSIDPAVGHYGFERRATSTGKDVLLAARVNVGNSFPRRTASVVALLSARGGQSHPPSASPIDVCRPGALGVALADVVRLVVCPAHRQTGHRRPLASTWLSPVLDLEEPAPHRTTGRVPR
jgi:hypothetical protein